MKKALIGIATAVVAAIGGYYGLYQDGTQAPSPFSQCVHEILEDQRSTGNLTNRVQAVQHRYGLDTAKAEDVVFDTLLAVCQK